MIEGNVRAMLRDEHYRGTMRKWGLEPVVLEMIGCIAILESEGIDTCLEQRHSHRGPRSWALTVGGRTWHLRPVKTKLGYRLALKDGYRNGNVVAKWATPEGVQRWFDTQARRVERSRAQVRADEVNDQIIGALGDVVAVVRGAADRAAVA